MAKILSLLGVLIASFFHTNAPTAKNESLILFVEYVENTAYTKADTDALEAFMKEEEIPYVIIDITGKKVPKEIQTTPTIVYQNPYGRSFFYGRYKNTDRLKNFIRTSRFMPQVQADNIKKDIWIYQLGRATIAMPIKFTPLSGTKPKAYDEEKFKAKVLAEFSKNLSHFKQVKEINLLRTAKLFYLDIHPHRGDDGKIYVAWQMFSQFNCVKPIASHLEDPIVGKYNRAEQVFAMLAKAVEKEFTNQMNHSKIGDSFNAIGDDALVATWAELGMGINPQLRHNPIGTVYSSEGIKLKKDWTFLGSVEEDMPIIQFHFAPPLDSYSGEVKEMNGHLNFGEKEDFRNVDAAFNVPITAVTMGDMGLDDAIHGKILNAAKFPNASFKFDRIETKTDSLQFGKSIVCDAVGTFTLMGKEIPMRVPAQIDVLVKADKTVHLSVMTAFKLNIEEFSIKGPDGPSPEKNTMQFYLRFLLG